VRKSPRRIVFPEGDDARVVDAASRLKSDGLIGEAVLLGRRDAIMDAARRAGASLEGCAVMDIEEMSAEGRYRDECRKARRFSVLEDGMVRQAVSNPVVLGALMLRLGEADGFLGGIRTTTAEILSTGIGIIKADRREGVVTSFSIVMTGNREIGENGLLVLADPAVNPDPGAGVLCRVAEAAARFARRYLDMAPRIAFLSYSTLGSASGKSVEKVRLAAERARKRMPETEVEGELQLDAAVSPGVRAGKAPRSAMKGSANILIFPNLDSANIGSKLLQYVGGASVIGPVIYGLGRPFNDLSRAATAEDIYNCAIITQLQCQPGVAGGRFRGTGQEYSKV
jgi:phosphate acetyltransferase